MAGTRAEVLGPIRILAADGGAVPVTGTLPRRLLAALALAGPEGRSAGALVDDVWADDPPRNPRAALQMLVSRLRASSGDGLVLSTASGYRLAGSDLADAGSALGADPAALGAALAEWRGEPGADLDDPGLADALAARAADLRARLLGEQAAALLREGRPDEALAAADLLRALAPLDGGPVLLAMRALDALGRPAEALAAYAAHAERLADELGADPDPAVAALHVRLLRAAPAAEGRLVGVRTGRDPLLGRERDLAEIDAALRGSRLVTVLGPGGMGKTRIAHEAAAAAAGRFGRVVFVELAGTQTGEDVLLAAGEAAGARGARATRFAADVPAPDVGVRTTEALAAARTLLVLDNCEHVVDAAAALADDLLGAVPDLVVLTTSRVPLLVPGERLHPLPPLAADSDGAVLFERRARAARPDVRLDEAAVRRVVGHLDGLPLAIELAAARLRTMTLDELESRLADRFGLLVGGGRTAPARHRTLFAVIDWSWRLLPPGDQQAAALLGAFPDGFTAAGAADLLGRDAEPLLTALVDQSLLVFREEPRPRYRMLETVREFAVAATDRAGLQEEARSRLDAAALALVRRLEPRRLQGPDAVALTDLVADEELLRTVLRLPPAGREPVVIAVFAALAESWLVRGEFESILEALPRARAAVEVRGRDAIERRELLRALVLVGTVVAVGREPGAARVLALLRRARSAADGGGLWPAAARLVLASAPLDPESPLLAELTASTDPAVATFGALTRSQLLENAGRSGEALVEARRAERLAARHGSGWFRMVAGTSVVQLHSQRGERAAALAAGEAVESSDFTRATGADLRQQDWLMGVNLVAVGRLDEARIRFDRLAALPHAGRATEAEDLHAIALAGLAELAAAEGDDGARSRRWADADAASRRASAPWAALISGAAAADAARRGDRAAGLAVYRRLRPRLLALIRSGDVRVDRPVVASAALGLSAVLRSAAPDLADRLAAAALDAGVRVDLPALQAARDAVPAHESAEAGDPTRRIRALLEQPAARI